MNVVEVGMLITVHGSQSYLGKPVATLSLELTEIFDQSAADTVAVTVLAAFAKLVIDTEAAAPLLPGTAPLACTVAALVRVVTVLLPVPSFTSVMRAFELSNIFPVADNCAVHDPLGQ